MRGFRFDLCLRRAHLKICPRCGSSVSRKKRNYQLKADLKLKFLIEGSIEGFSTEDYNGGLAIDKFVASKC